MTVYRLLETLGLPVVFGRHTKKINTPYLVISGNGQNVFPADNTYYWTRDQHTIELYFTDKDYSLERQIEKLLLDNGWPYEKSEDIYLNDQEVFYLYYNI